MIGSLGSSSETKGSREPPVETMGSSSGAVIDLNNARDPAPPLWPYSMEGLGCIHLEFGCSFAIYADSLCRYTSIRYKSENASLILAPSVNGDRFELTGDVPDQGSGVEGYVRVVADLVQD